MTPLPPDELSKGEEQTVQDCLENYRPVRQRTVRSETTKTLSYFGSLCFSTAVEA